tara:strand:- start:199 stop:1875 length:1677 start_codon:yes stop_codon:yes gene_type:complete
MRIVKLDIDENSILAGIDAVALVEQPAIEEDFMYFSKQNFAETFNDYPQSAVKAAKRGIELNKEGGNKCATQVGKVRAQQLANGENVSLDTIRRMRAFLIRQKDNYDLAISRKDYEACGYISYLLWGGPTALGWTEKKLRQAGEDFTTDEDIIEELIKQEMDIVTRIENIPVYSEKQEAIDKAKEIGCTGYHEHTLASGEIVFMPCDTHDEATDKILSETFDDMKGEEQDAIINALESVGISDSDMLDAGYTEVDMEAFHNELFAQIITTPNKPSQADFGQLAVRYRYTGPKDDRNRKFCSRLLKLNKIFRREDINNLSIVGENVEFGIYDIFRYKGSYNCRHYWAEKFYKRDSTISKAKRALADSTRILDGTTTNNAVIQKSGKSDADPGLAKTSFAALDEKQMLVGPLMVPNKLIPRIDEEGNEYYVYFTEETIKKLSYKMMKDKLIDSVNIEHDNTDRVEDAYLVESWLIEDASTDKSKKYGFNLPNGTWMGMYKIDNLNIWEDYVKTGLVRGFSIEGFFEQYTMSKTKCRKNGDCGCGMSQNPAGLCDGSHLKK